MVPDQKAPLLGRSRSLVRRGRTIVTGVVSLLGVLLVSGIAYGSWWVLKKTQAEPEAMSGTAMVSGNSAAGAKDDGWELNDAAKAAKELEQAEEQRA